MNDQNPETGDRSGRDSRPRGAVPRRVGAYLAAGAVLAVALAGCGHDRVKAVRSTAPPTTLMIPMQSKIPVTPVDSTVGRSVTTNQGNVITVYQIQSPAAYAEAGFVIDGAEVGVCAASTTIVTEQSGVVVHAGITPRFFSVQLDDGTLQEAQLPGGKEPALASQLLKPGQCVRGWVTFHVPEQRKVSYVVFRSLSVVRWKAS